MLDRLHRSWRIARQSWFVLMADKHLLVFPVISTIACLVVLASFAYPFYLALPAEAVRGENPRLTPAGWMVVFGVYFFCYFVITFCNSALMACVLNRFNGGDSSAGAGLRAALQRLPQIFAWAAFAATVGVLLQMLLERLGFIGRLIIKLVGMLWTVATFFVVPVLVVDGVGPFDAVRRSIAALRRTWGESLVTSVGLGAVGWLAGLVACIPAIIGLAVGISMNSPWPAVTGGAITVVAIFVVMLVISTLKSIVCAALYRYATTGVVAEGFAPELLQGAFRTSSR